MIYPEHLVRDGIPGKVPRHPLTASVPHCVQRLTWQGHCTRQGLSEGLDPMIDPPAAALALKPAPRRALGRDYWCSGSERFGGRQTEVLVQSRKDKNVGVAVSDGFRVTVDRVIDRNSGETKSNSQFTQLLVMAYLRRSSNFELPARIPGLDF